MSGKGKRSLKILTGLIVLLLANLACAYAAEQFDCMAHGGNWEIANISSSRYYVCRNADPAFYEKYPDKYFPSKSDQANENQETGESKSEEASPPVQQDSADFDPASCLPQPGDYRIYTQNLNDRTSSNGKHVCGADGMITNISISDQTLMFSVFRINNYGAGETKYPDGKWLRKSYQLIEPGETIEYGGFYRCTGPGCDGGEWYHIQQISILNNEPGCLEYALSFEDRPPESIVPVENPCSW